MATHIRVTEISDNIDRRIPLSVSRRAPKRLTLDDYILPLKTPPKDDLLKDPAVAAKTSTTPKAPKASPREIVLETLSRWQSANIKKLEDADINSIRFAAWALKMWQETPSEKKIEFISKYLATDQESKKNKVVLKPSISTPQRPIGQSKPRTQTIIDVETINSPAEFFSVLGTKIGKQIFLAGHLSDPRQINDIQNFLHFSSLEFIEKFGLDPSRITSRSKIDFGKIISKKDFILEITDFLTEVETLLLLGWTERDIFSTEYISIIREMAAQEYAEHFPESEISLSKITGEYIFVENETLAQKIKIEPGHIALAKLIRSCPKEDSCLLKVKELLIYLKENRHPIV